MIIWTSKHEIKRAEAYFIPEKACRTEADSSTLLFVFVDKADSLTKRCQSDTRFSSRPYRRRLLKLKFVGVSAVSFFAFEELVRSIGPLINWIVHEEQRANRRVLFRGRIAPASQQQQGRSSELSFCALACSQLVFEDLSLVEAS